MKKVILSTIVPVNQRSVHVKDNKCCSIFLILGHKTKDCRNQNPGRYRPCGKHHYTTLPQDNLSSNNSNNSSENKGSTQTSTNSAASFSTVVTNSSPCEHATSLVHQPTLVMTGQVVVESASG